MDSRISAGTSPGVVPEEGPVDRPHQAYPLKTKTLPDRSMAAPPAIGSNFTRVVNSSAAEPASIVISPEKSPRPTMCAVTSHFPASFGARVRARHDAHSGVCNG